MLRARCARQAGIAVCLGAAAIVLACACPAGAVLVKSGGHSFGVTPVAGVNPASLPGAYPRAPVPSASGGEGVKGLDETPHAGTPLLYHGGPVMETNSTHVIYWDPNKEFTPATKAIINKFFTGVAHDSGLASNVFGIAGQYTDATGNAAYHATFAGEETDEAPYPSSGTCAVPKEGDPGPPYTKCLFDSQLREQLSAYIGAHGLPRGPTQLYFVLFPHKVVTCFEAGACSNNKFCAYHSGITPQGPNEIIYADIPFSLLDENFAKSCQADGFGGIQTPNGDTAGTKAGTRYADVALKYISHEYMESITDPFGTSWFDAGKPGQEIGDKCNSVPFEGEEGLEPGDAGVDKSAFAPVLGGSAATDNLFDQEIDGAGFYLQSEWDNAAKSPNTVKGTCLMRPLELTGASFTSSPTPAAARAPARFAGSVADPYGAPEFSWNFGDGQQGSGVSVSHTYAALGRYTVVVTPKDRLTGATGAASQQTLTVADRPAVVTGAATTVGPSSATLNATVNPDLAASECRFEYGPTSSYGASAPCSSSPGSGESPVPVSAALSGLSENTTYHYRIAAVNSPGESQGEDETFATPANVLAPSPPPIAVGPLSPPPPAPNSSFTAGGARSNARTGAITFTDSVAEAGTFSWLLTFQNGKFGVFAASGARCKQGFVKLGANCRPAQIVFARGSRTVAAAGSVSFTVKPSGSALKALENAAKHKRGVPVTATVTFQSARGGRPASHTATLTVKLKKA